MIEAVKLWWDARMPREKLLLAVMGVLLAGVVLWLGVYRPVESALRGAALANLEAAQRHASVSGKIEFLKSASKAAGNGSSLPVEQVVGQSAGEAGFTLDRVQAQGADRVEISIASARSTALMGWIATLEEQGVSVERAAISPSGGTGTVSAQITFRRMGG